MRNKVFRTMLQLFAEEPGGDPTPPTPPNPDPDGKPEVTDSETPPAPEAKYTEEDIERMRKEWEKSAKAAEEEAKKLAKMNAQEKADYKNKQLEDKIAELENEKALSNMRDEARKMLSEKNINISDELLAFMVSKDAGETKKAVDSFVELFNAAVNEAVKGKARQETPKDGGGFSASKASLGIGDMAREARIIK